jgi:hypothetical protein
MATRARTKKTADTADPARCEPHGVKGTCWRCCQADMDAHLTANGIDPSRYSDGRNGEGTTVKAPPMGNGLTIGRPAEPATDAQVWKIRTERDRRDTSRVQIPADADIPAMSKRAASALIDKLTDRALCPLLPADQAPTRRYAPRAATPGQISYVRDLLSERVHADPVDLDTLTFDGASALIDALIRAPRLVDASALADGMYVKDDVMYRVRTDRHGRKRCHRGEIVSDAERADDGTITKKAEIKFYAANGMLAKLTDADLMASDQVTTFGRMYGICVYGHGLTDPVSVYAGIGPKCAANEGIDQLATAIANGYVPPVKAARKTRATRVTVAPAPALAEAVTGADASPWSMV